MKDYIFPKYNKKYEEFKRKDGWLTSQGFKKLWNYFLDVIYKESFIGEVEAFRKKYNIPKNGFKFNDSEDNKIFTDIHNNNYKTFYRDIENLCLKYYLDALMWAETMDFLIGYNLVQEPDGVSLCRQFDLETEIKDPYIPEVQKLLDEAYPVFIRISPYASQRDIVDWIRKNFKMIKGMQNKYAKIGVKIGKSKTKDLQIKKRNEFIYKHKNMHYKDLVVKVDKQFPKKITDSIDEGSIGKIISLETKKRKDM